MYMYIAMICLQARGCQHVVAMDTEMAGDHRQQCWTHRPRTCWICWDSHSCGFHSDICEAFKKKSPVLFQCAAMGGSPPGVTPWGDSPLAMAPQGSPHTPPPPPSRVINGRGDTLSSPALARSMGGGRGRVEPKCSGHSALVTAKAPCTIHCTCTH